MRPQVVQQRIALDIETRDRQGGTRDHVEEGGRSRHGESDRDTEQHRTRLLCGTEERHRNEEEKKEKFKKGWLHVRRVTASTDLRIYALRVGACRLTYVIHRNAEHS